MKNLLIVLGVIVFISLIGGCSYNSMVSKEENVKAKWGAVQSQYQRRSDLIPNLVATVKGVANFEKSTLTDVIQARAKATSVNVDINDPKTLEAYQNAQAGLQSSFSKLLAVVENYPDLKTTAAFQGFQTQIEGTENRINVARQDYNAAVQDYNLRVKRFPNNIFAGMFGYHEKAFYQAAPGSENAPNVNFDIK